MIQTLLKWGYIKMQENKNLVTFSADVNKINTVNSLPSMGVHLVLSKGSGMIIWPFPGSHSSCAISGAWTDVKILR